MRKAVIIISSILFVIALCVFLVFIYRKNTESYMELTEGNSTGWVRHGFGSRFFPVFIDKEGEIKIEEATNSDLNNNTHLLLEKAHINELTRKYLDCEIVKYDHTYFDISENGKIYLTDKTLTKDELKETLMAGLREYGRDLPVLILADKNLPHHKIKPVLDMLRDSGFIKVKFVALRKGSNEPYLITAWLKEKDTP